MQIPLLNVDWAPCWRIIPARYPPIALFERIANPDDFEALFALEKMTNESLRDEVGAIHLIPLKERRVGKGTGYIMAPFIHFASGGSRFSDGTWGVFYAAHDLDTAISETKYHREHFMRQTNQSPMHLEMKVLAVNLKGLLHSILSMQEALPAVYSLHDYSASQALARRLVREHSYGIIYSSVRRKEGLNAAVFRPSVLSHCREERFLDYVWDGKTITHVLEKKLYSALH